MFGALIVFCCWFGEDPEPQLEAKTVSAQSVATTLEQWESATANLPDRSAAVRESLRLKITNKFNGHAAVVFDQFAGRVQAKQLAEQFTWTQVSSDEDQICLEARPNDETEQLFVGSIRVWLNKSYRLARLQAMDRQGEARASWKADPGVVVVAQANETSEAIGTFVVGADKPIFDPNRQIKLVSARASTPATEITPEIAGILEKWEAESRKIETAQIQFRRTIYNRVFDVEKVADGTLIYMAPDKIKITVKPAKIQEGDQSSRVGKSGRPFRLEGDRAETWIFTPKQIIMINEEEMTFERVDLDKVPPIDDGGWRSFLPIASSKWYELPFSLNIRAEQLKQDWTFKVFQSTSSRKVMVMTSETPQTMARCNECWVNVESEPFGVSALKYFDPPGNSETVYKINRRILNQGLTPTPLPHQTPRRPGIDSGKPVGDMFEPNLEALGYKQVLPKVAK